MRTFKSPPAEVVARCALVCFVDIATGMQAQLTGCVPPFDPQEFADTASQLNKLWKLARMSVEFSLLDSAPDKVDSALGSLFEAILATYSAVVVDAVDAAAAPECERVQ